MISIAETTLTRTLKKQFFYLGELVEFDSGGIICKSLDHARFQSPEISSYSRSLFIEIIFKLYHMCGSCSNTLSD